VGGKLRRTEALPARDASPGTRKRDVDVQTRQIGCPERKVAASVVLPCGIHERTRPRACALYIKQRVVHLDFDSHRGLT